MMNHKYYYIENYLKTLKTKVVEVTKDSIVLEKTIAYPEGGGQRGDRGYINNISFIDTKLIDNKVHHFINTSNFNINDDVEIVLDWDFRYNLMQKHTAQHLLSGLMYTNFNIQTTSVHLGDEYITIETDQDEISDATLLALEDIALEKIRENHKVLAYYIDEEIPLRRPVKKIIDKLRIVEIENNDKIACGGLHVASLAEIEELSYLYCEKIRSKVRIYWLVSKEAKEKRRANSSLVKNLSSSLSCKDNQIISYVDKLINDNKELKSNLRHNYKLLVESLIEKSVKNNERIIYTSIPLNSFIDNLCSNDLLILNKSKDKVLFLFSGKKEHFDIIKPLVKGGGREPLFQGYFNLENENEILNLTKKMWNIK